MPTPRAPSAVVVDRKRPGRSAGKYASAQASASPPSATSVQPPPATSRANRATSRAAAPAWTIVPSYSSICWSQPISDVATSCFASASHASRPAAASAGQPSARSFATVAASPTSARSGRRLPPSPSAQFVVILGPDDHLLLGVEQRRPAVAEVGVERAAQHQDDVGQDERDAAVDQRAQAPGMAVGDEPARGAGRGDRDARGPAEAGDRVAGARPERAAAGQDEGPLGAPEQVARAVQVGGGRGGPRHLGREALQRLARRRHLRDQGVLGHLQVHRAGAASPRAVHGLRHVARDPGGLVAGGRPLDPGRRDRPLVEVGDGALAGDAQAAAAAEQHHRHVPEARVEQAAERVGEAGAGGGDGEPGAAGGERPALGREGRRPLVAGVDDADAGRHARVEHLHHVAASQREHRVDAGAGQRAGEEPAARHRRRHPRQTLPGCARPSRPPLQAPRPRGGRWSRGVREVIP